MKTNLATAMMLLLLCQTTVQGEGHRTNEKTTELGTAIQTGFGLARYHDTCIQFRVYFIAKDFFHGLKRTESAKGPVFKKNHDNYRKFPDPMTVDVEATAFPCDVTERPIPPPEFASGLLASPTFRLNWGTETGSPPISVISTRTRHQVTSLRWDYYLEIQTKDANLDSQMTIDCLLRAGAERVRLTAQLG